MQQKVRKFCSKDVEIVAEMFKRVQDGWSAKSLKDSLENDSIQSYVMQVEDKIVAFVSYLVSDDAELVFVITQVDSLKMGYAKSLIETTFNQIGLDCVLEVRESNLPAINLYEKLGFEPIGKRKNFYQNPTETAIIYKKSLQ